MRARGISVFAVIVGLAVLPALAAEEPAPQQADNAASPAPAASEPGPAAAGPAGLAQEFAERLAETGNLAAADREDRAALAKFYAGRQHEPVGSRAAGLTPAAAAAMAEMRRADEWGLDAAAFQVPALSGSAPSRASRADAEIALSLAILKYARHARGGRAEPTSLSRNLDRKLPCSIPPRSSTRQPRPRTPTPICDPCTRSIRSSKRCARNTWPCGAVRSPIRARPRRARKAARKPRAPPPRRRARARVLVNMEEWRWMPESLGDFYVWVNIPEYTLRVVKAGKVIHTERVIVGKRDTQTPVFSQDMEQVIFHPVLGRARLHQDATTCCRAWRAAAPGVLERYNLRIQRGGRDIDPASVDWASADIRQFHVYQPPGPTTCWAS